MISESSAAFDAHIEYINFAILSPSVSFFVILSNFCIKKSINTSSPIGVEETAVNTSL